MRLIQGRLRVAGLMLAVGALLAVSTVPAVGASQLPIECSAAAVVDVVADPVTKITTWVVAGKGSCVGDLEGTYFVDFNGIGTSRGLGICTQTSVINLNIQMSVSLTSTSTGVTKFLLEDWTATETTFPFATPFLVERQGNPLGAGVILTRIFGHCPPEGSPAAWIEWSQTK